MPRALIGLVITAIILLAGQSAHAVQYLNRRLIQCDPLMYVVEPLEIVGGTLDLTPWYSNQYGDCTGLTPGPPFIIEDNIVIENEYNPDWTVLNWGGLIIDNRFGATGSMDLQIVSGNVVCRGYVEALGQSGAMVVFSGSGRFDFAYGGGPNYPDFTRQFSYCRIQPGEFVTENFFEIDGGHLTLDNCRFGPTDSHLGLSYSGGGGSAATYDVVLKDCYFDGTSMDVAVSPNQIGGARSIDIDGLRFENCLVSPESPVSVGCLQISSGDVILKNLTDISGSSNTHDWIVFGAFTECFIKDSVTVRTTKDFPPVLLTNIHVDSNAVLSMEKGSVIQMAPDAYVQLHPKSRMVTDSSVITSYADRAHGLYLPGLSSDAPSEADLWMGANTDIGSKLTVRNHSKVRWTYGPIAGEGNITVDHSTIEQSWGSLLDIQYTSPCSLRVIGSTLRQTYGPGEGINFVMSINAADSATGYLVVDSSVITRCGGDGIYLGGGAARPLTDDLRISVTNCDISGNGGSGVFGLLSEPTDSVVIMNNCFIGNGARGLWIEDNGCDSMAVRLETNAAIGNGGTGLGIETGFVEAIGNTSAFNDSYGLYYPYKPRRPGHIANNLLAFNDGAAIYCYAKYGGTMPEIAHNIFWQNYDATREMNIRSDDYDIYTVADLQALGGPALTNMESNPLFYARYQAKILSRFYDSAASLTGVWFDGPAVEAGKLEGLPILPTKSDTTAWFFVERNSGDSLYIAGDARSVLTGMDSLTVFEFHITRESPAVESGDTAFVTSTLDVDGHDRIIDADANGTRLVDIGADEFDTDTTTVLLFLSYPTADTTLIPNSTLTIAWGAFGFDNVKIEYALDVRNGQAPSWQTLAASVGAMPGLFPWTVPDTISYRTPVRISDAAGSGYEQQSGYFHIKPPVLTRVTADSAYERYRPSLHSWQLGNDSATIWPDTWFGQFDYINGTDPYTNEQYPSWDMAYPFGLTPGSVFPDWPLYVDAFTEGECFNTTPSGTMYRMRAVSFWDLVTDRWNGSCAGLSTTSLLAFLDRPALQALWPSYTIADPLHNQTLDNGSRYIVNKSQLQQYGRAEREMIAASMSESTVMGTITALQKMLLGSPDSVAWLGIGCQTGDCWHAMAAYAIDHHPDPTAIAIRVYDPNRPGVDTATIRVDTLSRVWYYSGFPGWGGSGNLILGFPVRYALDAPDLKSLIRSTHSTQANEDSLLTIVFDNDCEVMIHDPLGDSIGFNDAGLVQTIAGAGPLLEFEGGDSPPYGWLVPDASYHDVMLSDMTGGAARIGFYYDSLYVGYARVDADSLQTDRLRIGGGLTITSPDTASKSVWLSMAITLADGERVLVVDSLEIGAGDTLRLEPVDSIGWYLNNPGGARTYRLWMRQVNTSEKEWKFRSHDVPLEAGVAHLLTPDWSNLNEHSCMIYVDYNGNYLADDSIMLYSDIPVGVDDGPDEALPVRFELLQNYPNPFNPATTIEYSLPTRSHVTIEIFNILGQIVQTLVNRDEPAGSYTITWDGRTADGRSSATGVYLYRFQAGDHVETKKMLLLK